MASNNVVMLALLNSQKSVPIFVDDGVQGDAGLGHLVGVVEEFAVVPSEPVDVIEDHVADAVSLVRLALSLPLCARKLVTFSVLIRDYPR